jgi:hypothetical protein
MPPRSHCESSLESAQIDDPPDEQSPTVGVFSPAVGSNLKVLFWLGAAFAVLLAVECVAFAAPDNPGSPSSLSIGTGIIFYGRDRIYHATTQHRELNFKPTGTKTADSVEVTDKASTSAQLLLEYSFFGRKRSREPLFSADSISAILVTSYGIHAENRKFLDGLGLGYTIAVFDAFHSRDSLRIGLGVAWFNDVHVLRNNVEVGEPIPPLTSAPTRRTQLRAGMLTISIGL